MAACRLPQRHDRVIGMNEDGTEERNLAVGVAVVPCSGGDDAKATADRTFEARIPANAQAITTITESVRITRGKTVCSG